MPTQVFTIVLDQEPTDPQFDALVESGCDDCALIVASGVPTIEFDREGETLAEAIASAVHDIERAGLRGIRVLDGDLLTLADIADRIGRKRETVRRYATGERGPGGFPPPINPGREGTAFYRWTEVAPWLREHVDVDVSAPDPTLAVANLVLQIRRLGADFQSQLAPLAALADLGIVRHIAERAVGQLARLHFEVYPDQRKGYSWRVCRADNSVLAVSAETYADKADATKALDELNQLRAAQLDLVTADH